MVKVCLVSSNESRNQHHLLLAAIEGMDASSLMAYIDAFVGRAPITKSELAVLGKEKVEAFLFAGGSSSHLWPLTPVRSSSARKLFWCGIVINRFDVASTEPAVGDQNPGPPGLP